MNYFSEKYLIRFKTDTYSVPIKTFKNPDFMLNYFYNLNR